MACRATDDAATAATDGGGPRRPKTRQRRRRDAGSPPTAPRHHTARNPTVLGLSPVLSRQVPTAVRTHSNSKKKPPSAIILRKDLREGAGTLISTRGPTLLDEVCRLDLREFQLPLDDFHALGTARRSILLRGPYNFPITRT